ncbi:MAG: hypothetical protein HPY44_04005 [Armatimonadetes bacterium]|nr:hypothetical protein [Armatimonadota bacterium]
MGKQPKEALIPYSVLASSQKERMSRAKAVASIVASLEGQARSLSRLPVIDADRPSGPGVCRPAV